MPDHSTTAGHAAHPVGRRHGRWFARRRRPARGLRFRLWRVAVLPAATALLVGAITTYGALMGGLTSPTTRMIIGGGVLAGVAIMAVALLRIDAVADAIDRQDRIAFEWLGDLRSLLSAGQEDLQRLVDQIQRGERPVLPEAQAAPPSADAAFGSLEQAVHATVQAALRAVVDVSSRGQVEVFVNLARRLQNLVVRSLDELDGLEKQVEDPDLLHGLFHLDHLVTRLRRQVESLAILGGAVPRRITRPMPVSAVLRSAVSEVEDYGRVKLLPPMDGVLHGPVAADVIHAIAELVENATNFSPPDTKVELRVEPAAAGLVIEIDDRGLGMPSDLQARMNSLLTMSTLETVDEQIKDGRIGLLVVAHLARRHQIPVQLQRNVYGGCRATVLLPHALLMSTDAASEQGQHRRPPEPAAAAGGAPRQPAGAGANGAAVLPAAEAKAPAAGGSHGGGAAETVVPAASARADDPSGTSAAGEAGRPRLPERLGSHLVPELRRDQDGDSAPPDPAPPQTGLMARFTAGTRAAEDTGPASGDEHVDSSPAPRTTEGPSS